MSKKILPLSPLVPEGSRHDDKKCDDKWKTTRDATVESAQLVVRDAIQNGDATYYDEVEIIIDSGRPQPNEMYLFGLLEGFDSELKTKSPKNPLTWFSNLIDEVTQLTNSKAEIYHPDDVVAMIAIFTRLSHNFLDRVPEGFENLGTFIAKLGISAALP